MPMSISHTLSTRSFLISGHVTTHSRKLPFNRANSPFAQRIADRKRLLPNPLRRFFLAEWYFITKLGPQVSLFPIPFFGVNNYSESETLITTYVTMNIEWSELQFSYQQKIRQYYSTKP
jgi:hypothetical protein